MQGKKQRLRAKMSKPSELLPSMCPEKGAFVLHTTNVTKTDKVIMNYPFFVSQQEHSHLRFLLVLLFHA